MNVETLVVGCIETNCLVLWGNGADSAIVVDPGGDVETILDFLRSKKLSVAAYVLTHGHVDHISAVAELYASLPAPIAIHRLDLDWAFDDENSFLPYLASPRKPAKIERVLADGQEWNDAGLTYQVVSTPGHTPGSVCLYFQRDAVLVTGDTLFAGSVGRTDLPGGDSRALQQSLQRIAVFPPDTVIYPGHGPSSTIREEKASNFFLSHM